MDSPLSTPELPEPPAGEFHAARWLGSVGLERRVESGESSGLVGAGGVLPKKPKYGAACNGCGICCAVQLCQLAEIAFKGASAPCPALKLTPDGSRTYCELVAFEAFAGVEPMLATALGIGLGCSMEDDE